MVWGGWSCRRCRAASRPRRVARSSGASKTWLDVECVAVAPHARKLAGAVIIDEKSSLPTTTRSGPAMLTRFSGSKGVTFASAVARAQGNDGPTFFHFPGAVRGVRQSHVTRPPLTPEQAWSGVGLSGGRRRRLVCCWRETRHGLC